ncbi:MAG: leucyl aminopeptidase [Planctomycetota bacterium]|nr:MAG: leucyl aminopeptidase [Planctomycetota bacterium]
MRSSLSADLVAKKNQLLAVLVPAGEEAKLPAEAPAANTWKQDFKDDAGSSVLLRGEKGLRWLLLRVPALDKAKTLDLLKAGGNARKAAEDLECNALALDASALQDRSDFVLAAVEGATMAGYDPAVLKKERKQAKVKRVQVKAQPSNAAMRQAVKQGCVRGQANLYARELQNLPPNVLTPKAFAQKARKVASSSDQLSVKVLGEKRMKDMGMGSLLGVSRGSRREAQLVHLTYKPKGKAKGKIAVVGKGLTFDSGGISLKPAGKMDEMKFDMSGAAAVLGLFHGLAGGATCPYEVHGVLGCVENMPGGDAQLPGDIVTAMNGKTIEVLNTDAEGRLVLADALTYAARKIKPDRMVNLATLTGACIIALGHLASGVMGNNEELIAELQAAGDRADERCWPLPMWEDYRKLTEGKYADLQNIFNPGQGGGTIAGACFLSYFVDEVPWAHLDIAGTAWEGPGYSFMSSGGRGFGTRLLLEFLAG